MGWLLKASMPTALSGPNDQPSPVATSARPGDGHPKRIAVVSVGPIRAFSTPSVAACDAHANLEPPAMIKYRNPLYEPVLPP